MKNPEKFSPAKEFEKLEQERISSGMLAVYPEIWGPIEEERKEQILELARQEIIKALQEKNFTRANELMHSIQNYFGENIIKERMASKEYVSQSPIKSETASEVQELFKSIDWDKAKKRLQEDLDWLPYGLFLAAEMHKFDPERFDKEVKISDDQWQRFVGLTESERNDPVYFLLFASCLKELNPKRFEKDVKIDDEYWDKIAKEVEEERNYPKWFVVLYEEAHSIDAQKIQERVSIDKSYWDKIKQEIKRISYCPKCEAMMASAAQRIKPEGLPDITVSQDHWAKMKYELEDMLKSGAPERFVFMYANDLKSLKVEGGVPPQEQEKNTRRKES